MGEVKERGFEALAFLSIAALCAWLVRCLTSQQQETMESIEKTTASIASTFSQATGEITGKVSGLAETLILGRDLPSPSENWPTSRTESESSSEPEIALTDLPETAQWAAEEEELLQRTEMPWQSSSPPNDLG
jgi:hypothetical protein